MKAAHFSYDDAILDFRVLYILFLRVFFFFNKANCIAAFFLEDTCTCMCFLLNTYCVFLFLLYNLWVSSNSGLMQGFLTP